MTEKTSHLTLKINLPVRHFVNRETAIAAAMEALSVEVPRMVDRLMEKLED